MKHPVKNMIRATAKELGLKIVYVHYFSDDIHGRLFPRERRILINACKPRTEHIFTILHEFGHFLLHFKNSRRERRLWFLELHWKTERLARFSSKMRRLFRYAVNKECGKEWEADLWAFCAFIYIARRLGGRTDLLTFLDRHPEKMNTFLLAAFASVCNRVRTPIYRFSKTLFSLFRSPVMPS